MIIWDEDKNIRLKLERNVSFEQISRIILEKDFIDILDHPQRHDQQIFVLEINDYIYVVPFIMDENENIIFKTAFPSRNLHKKYRGKK